MIRRLPIALLAALVLVVLPGAAQAAGASAQVGVVDCDRGAVPVTVANDGPPMRFEVLRGDEVLRSIMVSGPEPQQVFVPLAEGARALVTVRYGSSYVSSSVARSCSGGGTQVESASSASSADAPFVTSSAAAASSATARSPEANTPTGQPAPLPSSGSSPWWIATLAALAAMSLAVVVVLVSRRRRSSADATPPAPAGRPHG